MRRFFRQPWITRDREGRYAVDLPDGVRHALLQLGDELGDLLATDHRSVRRLFPVAYPDDPDREAGYQALIRGELIERHQAGIDLIANTVDSPVLTDEQLTAWLTTVNALRLVLGTTLGLDDEDDLDIDEADPRYPVAQLYQVLTILLDDIVAALAES